MSTESPRAPTPRNFTDLLRSSAAQIAVRARKRAAERVGVDYVGTAARAPVVRSTATQAHPYSSFEHGGLRRFERNPLARGRFDRGSDLPPFRIT
jgi:hypothetical protein